jgi:hypothetical protein
MTNSLYIFKFNVVKPNFILTWQTYDNADTFGNADFRRFLFSAQWLVSPPNTRAKATFVYADANAFGGDTNHGAEIPNYPIP